MPSWIRIRNLNADPDPDPATQISADPCGSGSETLICSVPFHSECRNGLSETHGVPRNEHFVPRNKETHLSLFRRLFSERNFNGNCSALLSAEFFHRTPAGYTAERMTRRKRNMGCYGLLSASCHLSPPPSNFPPPHTVHLSHRLQPRYQD